MQKNSNKRIRIQPWCFTQKKSNCEHIETNARESRKKVAKTFKQTKSNTKTDFEED